MTPAEAQVLLSMASAFDNRKPDADAAKAWAAALDGMPFTDCRLAIIEHFKSSTEYLMPVMIRSAVRRMRAKRIADHPPLTPPAELAELKDNPEATIAWLATMRHRIGNGEILDTDAAYGELKPRHLPDLRELMGREDAAGVTETGAVGARGVDVGPSATEVPEGDERESA